MNRKCNNLKTGQLAIKYFKSAQRRTLMELLFSTIMTRNLPDLWKLKNELTEVFWIYTKVTEIFENHRKLVVWIGLIYGTLFNAYVIKYTI